MTFSANDLEIGRAFVAHLQHPQPRFCGQIQYQLKSEQIYQSQKELYSTKNVDQAIKHSLCFHKKAYYTLVYFQNNM